MKYENHVEAFNERKETIKKWGLDIRGIENSQRIIGDNASKAIVELLSAYLHKKRLVEEGFQLNHSWFKSERVNEKLPEFDTEKIDFAQTPHFSSRESKINFRGAQELQTRSGIYSGVLDNKNKIVAKLIELEKLCENLSYGVPKEVEKIKKALNLFDEIEKMLWEMIE